LRNGAKHIAKHIIRIFRVSVDRSGVFRYDRRREGLTQVRRIPAED